MFKKLFNRERRERVPDSNQPSQSTSALIFVFDRLPTLEQARLVQRIEAIEPTSPPIRVSIDVNEANTLFARVQFNDHRLKLVGFNVPVPAPTVERTIQVSNWQQEQKQSLRNHRAQIICFYEGTNPNPTEQLLALYKMAYGFYPDGLLGVLDEDAWNCMPRSFVNQQVNPEMLQACRTDIPLGIWTGFVKFFKPDNQVWFCSKGHHRFGVPDFAYLAPISAADQAFDLFSSLFNYVHRYDAHLKSGDTAQLGTHYLRFSDVQEYHDYLATPSGTLVVEQLS